MTRVFHPDTFESQPLEPFLQELNSSTIKKRNLGFSIMGVIQLLKGVLQRMRLLSRFFISPRTKIKSSDDFLKTCEQEFVIEDRIKSFIVSRREHCSVFSMCKMMLSTCFIRMNALEKNEIVPDVQSSTFLEKINFSWGILPDEKNKEFLALGVHFMNMIDNVCIEEKNTSVLEDVIRSQFEENINLNIFFKEEKENISVFLKAIKNYKRESDNAANTEIARNELIEAVRNNPVCVSLYLATIYCNPRIRAEKEFKPFVIATNNKEFSAGDSKIDPDYADENQIFFEKDETINMSTAKNLWGEIVERSKNIKKVYYRDTDGVDKAKGDEFKKVYSKTKFEKFKSFIIQGAKTFVQDAIPYYLKDKFKTYVINGVQVMISPESVSKSGEIVGVFVNEDISFESPTLKTTHKMGDLCMKDINKDTMTRAELEIFSCRNMSAHHIEEENLSSYEFTIGISGNESVVELPIQKTVVKPSLKRIRDLYNKYLHEVNTKFSRSTPKVVIDSKIQETFNKIKGIDIKENIKKDLSWIKELLEAEQDSNVSKRLLYSAYKRIEQNSTAKKDTTYRYLKEFSKEENSSKMLDSIKHRMESEEYFDVEEMYIASCKLVSSREGGEVHNSDDIGKVFAKLITLQGNIRILKNIDILNRAQHVDISALTNLKEESPILYVVIASEVFKIKETTV